MKHVSVLLLLAAAALGGCTRDNAPTRPPAPWFTIGRGPAGYTSVDTSRIVPDGPRRLVWVRTDYLMPDSAPRVPGRVVRTLETRHRLDCGARTTGEMETILRDNAGAQIGGAKKPAAESRPFAAYPNGATIFPFVCNAISIADRHRRQGR
ncbi:MAG TPA: surface-adhesin E family protein [Longimicrobium sp.]|nr:surface-adhesin E family protein [Longimicrobium sp.]